MPRGVDRYDEARLQGRLWTPRLLDPSIVRLWFSDESPITISSGAVSQWNDLSASGTHVAQSTSGNRPSVAVGPRGLRSLLFTGANSNYFEKLSFTPTFANNPFTIFSAFKMISLSNGAICDMSPTTNTNSGLFLAYESGTIEVRLAAIGQQAAYSFSDTSAWHVTSGSYSGTGTSILARGDGGQQRTLSSSSSATASGLQNLRIGQLFQNVYAWDGYLGEILFLSSFLSEAWNYFRVEGYLAWKWDTVNLLRGDHPFKNRPPLIGD